MNFWRIFYNRILLPLMWSVFHIGGIFNKKIKRGIQGRENLFEHLQHHVAMLKGKHRLWFHASSLGEFEQAKPIIAEIKKNHPDVDIIATFFSPSGYEHSKNYKLANIISYLPFDTEKNAERFIELVQPSAAIMVRYDIWPNIIWALKKYSVPSFIANATMKKDSLRKLPIAKEFHRELYNNFSHILTVSENDRTSFFDFKISHSIIEVIGDTRFDQVMMRSADAQSKNILQSRITTGKKIFIVGQSWPEDEEVILPVLFKLQEIEHDLLTIIVPHEPTIEHLEQLEFKLESKTSYIRLSEINNYYNEKVILVDSVGVLVPLYKYAHIVYIGGSFRQGIHNVLEPAVFGVPVIYGPKHTNSQEAVKLANLGGGFVVSDERSLYRILRSMLDNEHARDAAGKISSEFVHTHCGATDRVLRYLEPFLIQ